MKGRKDMQPTSGSLNLTGQQESVEELGDLIQVARDVFDTWNGDGEIAWAQHAWAALGQVGLAQYETEVERARAVCRLLALVALAQEFYARAFDEGEPGAWSVWEEDTVGEYPRIDPFALGQLAVREGVDADITVGGEFEEGSAAIYAVRWIVRDQTELVAQALRKQWGDTYLFAALWTSAEGEMAYPLPDEAIRDIVNTGITGEKLNAWQWVESGMPVD
jgi:hypothetical protein